MESEKRRAGNGREDKGMKKENDESKKGIERGSKEGSMDGEEARNENDSLLTNTTTRTFRTFHTYSDRGVRISKTHLHRPMRAI